ncbi:hypothetical protein Dimus_001072 [Dionaea muscipula]
MTTRTRIFGFIKDQPHPLFLKDLVASIEDQPHPLFLHGFKARRAGYYSILFHEVEVVVAVAGYMKLQLQFV